MRCSVVAAIALLASAARADFATSLVPVPNGLGPGTATYDLVLTVTLNDMWTSTSMKATLSGATFYHHPLGSNTQPDPALLVAFPALAWDTFVTCPDGWPNTLGQGLIPGFAGVQNFGATTTEATWFDTPPNGGDGTWVLARLTLKDLAGAWTLKAEGAHSTIKGSMLIPFSLTVPEPGGLAVLAFGAVVLARARRAGRCAS